MSNAYSIPRRQQAYIPTLNVQDIEKTMAVKQNNFDYNLAQVNQAISQFKSIDLVRDKDKLHLYQNLQKVLNIVDDSDRIDFSKTGVGSELSSYIAKSIDGEVIKQAGNSQKIKAFNESLAERRAKGEISEKNYQYALIKAGYSNYMNGESDDLGSLTYYEYSDVDNEMLDYAKKLKEVYKDKEVEIMNPETGEIIKKSISALTQPEMATMLRKGLNEKQLKQLEINGSYIFGHDPKYAQEAIKSNVENFKKQKSQQIDLLKARREMADEEQKKSIDASIKMIEDNIKSYTSNMLDMKSPEQIGGYLLREQLVDEHSKALTKEFLLSDKYDASWVKMLREQDEKNRLQQASLNYNPNISTITAQNTLADEVDVIGKTKSAITKLQQDNSRLLQESFDKLPESQKNLIRDTMETIKNDPDVQKQFPNGISNETLQRLTIEKVGYTVFDPETRAKLLDSIQKVDEVNKKEMQLVDNYLDTNVMDKEMFDQTFNQESQMVLIKPDGSETTMGEFLRANGVRDYDSYKSFIQSNGEAAKIFKGNIALQSMDLSEDQKYGLENLMGLVSPAVHLAKRAINYTINSRDASFMHLREDEYKIFKKSMQLLTGENLEDVYEVEKVDNRGEGKIQLTLKNNNSTFAKIAQRTQDNWRIGAGDFPNWRPDKTIRNESSIGKLFSEQRYNEEYERSLGQSFATLPGNNVVRIQGAEKKENLDPVFMDILRHSSNIDVDWKKPIDLYKNEDGSITVYQMFKNRVKTSDGEQVVDQAQSVGVISANDVPKMGYLMQAISMESDNHAVSSLAELNPKIDNISYIQDSVGEPSEYQRKNIEGLNRLYNKNDPKENVLRNLSTATKSEEMIFTPQIKGFLIQDKEGQEIISMFKDMTQNTSNYSINMLQGMDGNYNISIDTKKGTHVGSIPISEHMSTGLIKKALNGTPQVFLSLYIKKRVDDFIKTKVKYNGR